MSLKVLHISWRYPNCSETYIRAEARLAVSKGIDYRVFSYNQGPGDSVVPVHYNILGGLGRCIDEFQPDILHYHNMAVAWNHRQHDLPSTLRVHGCEGDHHQDLSPISRGDCAINHNDRDQRWKCNIKHECNAFQLKHHIEELRKLKHIKGVFAFPQLAEEIGATSTTLYYEPLESSPKKKQVCRLGAIKSSGELQRYLDIAKMCPEYHFKLGVATGYDAIKGKQQIDALVVPPNAEVKVDVLPEEANKWLRESCIYLHTYPNCPYGLAISPFEAASAGAYVLSPYLFDIYHSNKEAAEKINDTLSWTNEKWEDVGGMMKVISNLSHKAGLEAMEKMFAEWEIIKNT